MMFETVKTTEQVSRTSHEVRGLKYDYGAVITQAPEVAPHTRCVD